MSLAAFPHPNERHATPPPTKTAFPSTWECCFGRKFPEKHRAKAWFLSQTTLTDPPNGRLISKTTLADPQNGRLILKTTLTDPPNGRLISKTTLTDPLNGHRILKATLTDPLNGRLILKAALTDPPNGRLISKTTLTDPPNGHIFRKTPLQTARRQVFHEKQRKPFRLFGSASSPHGMQQKAGCRETRSTAACLYIEGPSAFNLTILHSRSPADGADWRSWDTCAHSS